MDSPSSTAVVHHIWYKKLAKLRFLFEAQRISVQKSARIILLFFLVLISISHSNGWQQGPFTWWGWYVPAPTTAVSWQIGPLTLLPLFILIGLLWHGWKMHAAGNWSWGTPRVTLPVLGLTLLALGDIITLRLVVMGLMFILFWLVYLAVINLRPKQSVWVGLAWMLTIVIIVQASVAIAQFIMQRDIGLYWLGEMVLDPAQRGISVVMNGDTRWLRGYGLNSHPNRLGWKLALWLLLLWPFTAVTTGWLRRVTAVALVMGLAGLVISLSRSAWLGLLVGSGVFGLSALLAWIQRPARLPLRRSLTPSKRQLGAAVALFTGLGLFAVMFPDVLLGRLGQPTSSIELMPIFERIRDWRVAQQLLFAQPWQGVGLGQFVSAAQKLNVFAGMVHVVPLLVGVELGIPGLVCWLTLLLAPLTRLDLLRHYTAQTAVWLAVITIGMLQPEPTLFTLQGAAFLGLASGLWSVEPVNSQS